MAHGDAGTRTRRSRFDATPTGWLEFGSQVQELVSDWSGRGDITVFVGEGAVNGGVAAACWVPAIAEMEMDLERCFGTGADPSLVPDMRERDTHAEFPHIAGAVLHEAMHARHTRYDLAEVAAIKDVFVRELISSFDETRIELRARRRFPHKRAIMRACALKLSLMEMEEDENFAMRGALGVSCLALISLARVDIDVLDAADVEVIQRQIEAFFGEDLLAELRKIWQTAQRLDCDEDWRPLEKLAQEWVKLLEDAGHQTKPEELSDEQKEALRQVIEQMMAAAADAAEEAETEGQAQAFGEAADEAEAERAAEKQAKEDEREDSIKQSEKIFQAPKTTGPSASRETRSRLLKERAPKDDERAAATKVSRALRNARYRDRLVQTRSTEAPPGRLNSRAAMQGAAQKARGQMTTAQPWRHKKRYHVEDPNVTVGVMVDISGSMSSAMEPMATTAWMLSEAIRQVQGKSAMIYYGNGVFPVLKVGQHLKQVTVYSASDGTERFDDAFRALNGTLQLLDGRGARLLVIVSDLCYTLDQVEWFKHWMRRCEQEGVAVMVIPFDDGRSAEETQRRTGTTNAQIIPGVMSAPETAELIGRAAVDLLRKASASRR